MGQKWTRGLLFSGKPLDTNMVLCCTEKLCGGTDTAPQGAHPLYRLSTASKQKIYQSEKRKVIGQTTAPVMLTPVPVPLVNKAASPTGAHAPEHIAPTLYASPRHAHHQDHLPRRQRSAHTSVPGAASRSAAEGQALTQEPCGMTLRAFQGGSQESSGTAAGRAAPLSGAGRLLRGRTLRAALQRRPAPRSWQGGEATVTARSASERQSPREQRFFRGGLLFCLAAASQLLQDSNCHKDTS